MRHAAVLRDFRALAPRHHGDRERVFEWLAAAHGQAEVTRRAPATDAERDDVLRRMRRLVLRFAAANDRIQFRSTMLDDFTHTDWEKMRIFPLTADPAGARCGERTQLYSELVEQAFEQLYGQAEAAPDVIVHVTCTGYAAPSGAQRLVARRGWGRSTEVIHAYHMGCYASLPGVRIAASLLGGGKPRVDLVHTELCTLHMDPAQHSPEQLMVQSLFADGMIRYSAVSPASFAAGVGEREAGLEVLATHEEIVPGTEADMGWMTSDHGMRMSISRDVPQRIESALAAFFERLAKSADCAPDALRERAVFAVHPGGPRIIDQVQEVLRLGEAQVALSNAVLAEHGNMSSATLPHIWKAVVEADAVAAGTSVVSLAFGPGLTLSGAVLRKAVRA